MRLLSMGRVADPPAAQQRRVRETRFDNTGWSGTMKAWVRKADLLEIRPAEEGEMVDPGQFAKSGDMIVVRDWADDFLVRQRDLGDYVEVEVPE